MARHAHTATADTAQTRIRQPTTSRAQTYADPPHVIALAHTLRVIRNSEHQTPMHGASTCTAAAASNRVSCSYHESVVRNVERVRNERPGLLPEPVQNDEEDLDAAPPHRSTMSIPCRGCLILRPACAESKARWDNAFAKATQSLARGRKRTGSSCEEVACPHLQRLRLLNLHGVLVCPLLLILIRRSICPCNGMHGARSTSRMRRHKREVMTRHRSACEVEQPLGAEHRAAAAVFHAIPTPLRPASLRAGGVSQPRAAYMTREHVHKPISQHGQGECATPRPAQTKQPTAHTP